MKQLILTRWIMAGALWLAVPAAVGAQTKKVEKAITKENQVIVITRKADVDNKTTIEIVGDKVKINGKEASDDKNANVSVQVHKYRDMDNLSPMAMARIPGGAGAWNFNMDDDNLSLFSEDANRAMLGVVTDVDEKGAIIMQVSKESAAEKAGLQKGDIITRIEDKNVKNAGEVADIIHDHKPGDKVTIHILRNNKEQTVTAELGKWKGVSVQAFKNRANTFNLAPEVWGTPPTPETPRVMPFGFRGDTFGAQAGRPKLGLSIQDNEDGKGVKVIDVDEDSNAGKAGIEEDDIITSVNDKDIDGTDDMIRIIRENSDKTTLTFKLLRDGQPKTVEVRVPKRIKTADL